MNEILLFLVFVGAAALLIWFIYLLLNENFFNYDRKNDFVEQAKEYPDCHHGIPRAICEECGD